jgi:hypothetical protein
VAALRELADVLGLRLRGIAAAPDGAATADATVARQGGVA